MAGLGTPGSIGGSRWTQQHHQPESQHSPMLRMMASGFCKDRHCRGEAACLDSFPTCTNSILSRSLLVKDGVTMGHPHNQIEFYWSHTHI
ncbi:uncharacterized protein ACWYII_007088 isoform 3-T3 [Salvelinus alpinus]